VALVALGGCLVSLLSVILYWIFGIHRKLRPETGISHRAAFDKSFIIFAPFIIFGAMFFPPMRGQFGKLLGFHPLWRPPTDMSIVDVRMLEMTILVVVLLLAALWFAVRKRLSTEPTP
jgi:hypothetical protein